jgi:hypothetical protein
MGQRGLWTGKRLRDISSELAGLGLRVCPNTVRRLLDEVDYALHANRKSLCANTSPFRDQQFGLLNHLMTRSAVALRSQSRPDCRAPRHRSAFRSAVTFAQLGHLSLPIFYRHADVSGLRRLA